MCASPARGLTVAEQQAVEIARRCRSVRVLIMDEPTAALSAHEAASCSQRFGAAALGRSRPLHTHRLNEVFEIADRVTVFRDGKKISTRPTRRNHAREHVIREMVGRELATSLRARRRGRSCCG